MNLQDIYDYLVSCQSGTTITLQNSEDIEYAFTGLMGQLGHNELEITEYTLTRQELRIIVTGKCVLGALAQKGDGNTKLVMEAREEIPWFSLTVQYTNKISLDDFMSGSDPVFYNEAGIVRKSTSIMSAIDLHRPVVTISTDTMTDRYPFTLESGIGIAATGLWQTYVGWLQSTVTTSGLFNLAKSKIPGQHVDFWLEVPLPGASMPNGLFANQLFDGSLSFIIVSGALSGTGIAGWDETFTRVEIRCAIQLPGVKTPVHLSAPLFGESGTWFFSADFPEGLSVNDIAGFLLNIFGLTDDKEGLMLPDGSPLDYFRLYSLTFNFWDGSTVPKQIRATTATARPWRLPLPNLTLDGLSVSWSLLQGSAAPELQNSYMLSAQVAGTLILQLGTKQLRLDAKAALPELNIEAGLVLTENGTSVQLADLFGKEASEELIDGGSSQTLGRLDIWASVEGRTLDVQAAIYNVIEWKLGDIRLNLAEITANASFSQENVSFSVAGIFRVTQNLNAANAFGFVLMGGYSGHSWFFKGYLSGGEINIGALLMGLLGIDYSSEQSVFVLSQLSIGFDTKDNQFELSAAFNGNWGMVFGNLPVKAGGRLNLQTSDKMEHTFLAAMLYLSIGRFAISAQVEDFFDDEKVKYVFQVSLDNHALRATYIKQKVSQEMHEILTVELKNTTLGDLVVMLVRMVNPNFRHSLPAPWSLLDKIDLSRFRLEYNMTDESISVSYTVDLKIPGLLELKSVGLRYGATQKGEDKSLRFVIQGKTLGDTETKTYGWDALNERPPDLVAQNDNRFHLHYFGIGSHYMNDAIRQADSIPAAMKALEDSLQLETVVFDPDAGFLLGLHFSFEEMLDFQLVFCDPEIYGINISVSAKKPPLDVFKGLELMLMYKKISKDIGMFKAVLTLPDRFRRINLGALNLTIGVLSLELYTNGDFLLDLGFPYNMDFSRSFALEAAQYCGHGGLYFGVLSGATSPELPQTGKGVFASVLKLGIGLSLGLGRSFDFGVVKGGVSLEVFGIFEGLFAIYKPKESGNDELYYSVQATVGLIGRLFLSADLKIIAINASVEIRAWAKMAITAYRPIEVELALSLKLEASIRILFIKIKFSFSFSANISFKLGDGGHAPWDNVFIRDALPLRLDQLSSIKLANREKVRIPLKVESLFSVDEGLPCAAFIPIVYADDFRHLPRLLADWMLGVFGEDITCEEALSLTFDILKDRASYACLSELFDESIVFELSSSELSAGQTEEQGVVIAMPPPVTLRFCSDMLEDGVDLHMDYWRDNLVDDAYARQMSEYFESLYPTQTKPQTVDSTSNETAPFAQIIFTDYVHMLLRHMLGALHGTYEEFTLDAKLLHETEQMTGLTLTRVLESNLSLTLNEGQLVLENVPFIVRDGETLSTLAEGCDIPVSQVSDTLFNVGQILDQTAVVKVPVSSIDNQTLAMTLAQGAAAVFARRWDEALKSHYQNVVDVLRQANPDLDMNWEEITGGKIVTMPNREQWISLPGDTLVRLAITYVLPSLNAGVCNEWDDFLHSVVALNRSEANDRPKSIAIPAGEVTLAGEMSFGTFERRLFPAVVDISEQKLIKPLVTVYLPQKLVIEQDSTLESVMGRTTATLAELASSLIKQPQMVVSGQTLLIKKPTLVKKSIIKDLLHADNVCDDAGTMASRFMLQGLRLPLPSEKDDDAATEAFYKMLGQQSIMDECYSHKLEILSGQSGVSWVSGALAREYSWDDIEELLPHKDFQWTSYVAKAKQMVMESTYVKTYTPDSSLCLQLTDGKGKALHFLNRDMCTDLPVMEDVAVTSDGGLNSTDVVAAIAIPLTLRKTVHEGVYELIGTTTDHRARLKGLHELCRDNSLITYRVYRAPSKLYSSGVIYEEAWDNDNCKLVRVNMSLETHSSPVTRFAETNTATDIATLGHSDFVRLLWECSVVGGGGYYLKMITGNGNTLSEEDFDEAGVSDLWIIAQEDEASSKIIMGCGIANALITGFNAAGGGAFGQGDISFMPKGNVPEQLKQTRQLLPAGSVGMEIALNAPGEEDIGIQATTRRLFNIISYHLEGDDYVTNFPDSTPLHPQHDGENDMYWHYSAVLPIYNFVKDGKTDSIYAALGKKPARVSFLCRDVLGNQLLERYNAPEIEPVYNDRIMGLHEWPGVLINYLIRPKTSRTGELVIRFFVEDCTTIKEPQQAYAKLSNSIRQLERQDVISNVETSLFGARWPIERKPDKSGDWDNLLGFGESLLKYWMGNGAKPTDYEMAFEIPTNEQHKEKLYALTVGITIERTQYLPSDESVCKCKTVVAPNISADMDGGETSTKAFADDLEKVLPNVKLARSGMTGDDYYIVTIGENGFIPSIKISPHIRENGMETIKAPCYWGLRPLANSLISRDVMVDTLTEGKWNNKTSSLRFSHIDIETWAAEFLADMENWFSGPDLVRAAQSALSLLQGLLAAKSDIAAAAAKQLEPIESGFTSEEKWPQQIVADRLRKSLSSGYKIASIAQYRLVFGQRPTSHFRLVVKLHNEQITTANESELQYEAGKIDSLSDSMCVVYQATQACRSGFPVDMKAELTELEYNIETEANGYESSSWLKFIIPIDKYNEALEIDTSSEVSVPNPLRQCPRNPELTKHECRMEDDRLYFWDYKLTCRADMAEQDSYNFDIHFRARQGKSLENHEADLFDYLAQYKHVREELLRSIQSVDSTIFLNGLTTYLELVQNVTSTWSTWKNNIAEDSIAADSIVSCKASVDASYEKEPVLTVSSEWPGVEAYYVYPNEPHYAGKRDEFVVSVSGLNLYQYNLAYPRSYIVRNDNLLRLHGGQRHLAVNTAFIYHSETVELPEIYAGMVIREERHVATFTGGFDAGLLAEAVSMLFEELGIGANKTVKVSTAVRYRYELAGTVEKTDRETGSIDLPVMMTPPLPCGNDVPTELTKAIMNWYHRFKPTHANFSLLFQVTIQPLERDELLLGFESLRIDFKES